MAAKMLELECPGCKELLELDVGFAGGVCRCSTCGTLMTVPADPARESAERLVRPDRPGGKTRRPSRPSAPGGSTARPAAPDAASPSRPQTPVRPARPDAPAAASETSAKATATSSAAPPAPTDDDANIYTTESGRIVRVDPAHAIPMARKRKVARYATYGVFVAAVGCIVAACLFAVFVLVRNPPTPPTGPGVIESFTYDRAANPFLLDKANVLGLPLRERTAILIDASASSTPWLNAVKQAIVAGLAGKQSGSQIYLAYAAGSEPRTLSDGFSAVNRVNPARLTGLHAQVTGEADADWSAAIQQAMVLEPSHVILISGRSLDDAQAQAIQAALAGQEGLFVDTIAMDRDIVALDDLAVGHGGRYVRLTGEQIRQWRAQAATAP